MIVHSVGSFLREADMNGHVVKLRGLGRLRGVVERNVDGGSYLAFKGIPYAKPPVGELRFRDPLPPEPWTGIREAAKFGAPCGQYNLVTREIFGYDDCLYLNVYVPSSSKEKILRDIPVMVWIHGGGFVEGSGNNFLYGPDYLIKKDVIIITINYRLGVLGFLNLEHKVAPGNQGLKDQVMALCWVQEHVETFGGDKNNVTIFGESAGAASVHYLAVSPMAKGLFHKAIAQSGSAFCPWASILLSPKKYAIRLLEYLGKRFSNEQETVEFLRTVECSKLIEAQKKIQTPQEKIHLLLTFGPGIDDVADRPFLPNFRNTLNNEPVKVPFILGYNNSEGIFFAKDFNEKNCKLMNADFNYVIHPQVLEAMKRDKKLIPSDLKRAYFGNEPLDPEKNLEKFIELNGDMHFVNGVLDLAKLQARNIEQPTYLYRFSYEGISPLKMMLNLSHVPGACHADDLIYVFYPHGFSQLGIGPPEMGSKERTVVERLTQMWTDFAKTGNPIPAESEFVKTTWKPVKEANELHYLEINEELRPGLNPDFPKLSTWNKISSKL